MQYDHIHDSTKWPYEAQVQIDAEKGLAAILFQHEGIVFQADRMGNASFFTEDGALLHQEKVDTTDHLLSKVCAVIRNGEIVVRIPIIEWVDHYPHCDGEYDRWSERILTERYIHFPLSEQK